MIKNIDSSNDYSGVSLFRIFLFVRLRYRLFCVFVGKSDKTNSEVIKLNLKNVARLLTDFIVRLFRVSLLFVRRGLHDKSGRSVLVPGMRLRGQAKDHVDPAHRGQALHPGLPLRHLWRGAQDQTVSPQAQDEAPPRSDDAVFDELD